MVVQHSLDSLFFFYNEMGMVGWMGWKEERRKVLSSFFLLGSRVVGAKYKLYI